jgi:hypothetical protein
VTQSERSKLLARARAWVRFNQCPLPMDLAFEILAAGMDVTAIESDLLYAGDTTGDQDHGAQDL